MIRIFAQFHSVLELQKKDLIIQIYIIQIRSHRFMIITKINYRNKILQYSNLKFIYLAIIFSIYISINKIYVVAYNFFQLC